MGFRISCSGKVLYCVGSFFTVTTDYYAIKLNTKKCKIFRTYCTNDVFILVLISSKME